MKPAHESRIIRQDHPYNDYTNIFNTVENMLVVESISYTNQYGVFFKGAGYHQMLLCVCNSYTDAMKVQSDIVNGLSNHLYSQAELLKGNIYPPF